PGATARSWSPCAISGTISSAVDTAVSVTLQPVSASNCVIQSKRGSPSMRAKWRGQTRMSTAPSSSPSSVGRVTAADCGGGSLPQAASVSAAAHSSSGPALLLAMAGILLEAHVECGAIARGHLVDLDVTLL